MPSSCSAAFPVHTASAARTVTLKVPNTIGAPEIVPFELSASPGGNAPPLTVHIVWPVPPLAASAARYVVRYVPAGSVLLVITSCAGATITVVAAVATREVFQESWA